MVKTERDPTPARVRGDDGKLRWEVNLRPWGFSWHYRLGPAEGPDALTEMAAAFAAMRKLIELQSADDPRDMTFAAAVEKWHAGKDYTTTSQRYGDSYAGVVARELGHYKLRELEGAKGSDILRAYRDELKARLAPATVGNRLSIVGQVIEFAAEDRHWMTDAPKIPSRPAKRAPIYTWIDHASFRALRAGIFSSRLSRANLTRYAGTTPLEVVIARRRVYCSWLFYTGVHTADADGLSAHLIALDFGIYIRVNSKSARCIPEEEFEMPLPLIADLREYLAIVGREFFLPGERLGGGPWRDAPKVIGETARELGIVAADERDTAAPPEVTPRVFRRAYARHMFSLGYQLHELADRMGQIDTTMLRTVYLRSPRPRGVVKSRWGMDGMTGAPAHAGLRVLPFRRGDGSPERLSPGQDPRNNQLHSMDIRPGVETAPGAESAITGGAE